MFPRCKKFTGPSQEHRNIIFSGIYPGMFVGNTTDCCFHLSHFSCPNVNYLMSGWRRRLHIKGDSGHQNVSAKQRSHSGTSGYSWNPAAPLEPDLVHIWSSCTRTQPDVPQLARSAGYPHGLFKMLQRDLCFLKASQQFKSLYFVTFSNMQLTTNWDIHKRSRSQRAF